MPDPVISSTSPPVYIQKESNPAFQTGQRFTSEFHTSTGCDGRADRISSWHRVRFLISAVKTCVSLCFPCETVQHAGTLEPPRRKVYRAF